MKEIKYNLLIVSILVFANSLHATLKTEKVILKPNMVLNYKKLPISVDSISDIFAEGMFYGRLRTNMFVWDWKQATYPMNPNGKLMDNRAIGIGGSFIYKTAPLSGISATLGLYTSQSPSWFREDASDVAYLKAGKDTFSRYKVKTGDGFGMTVLAQAYLEYDFSKTTFILGRQMFESVFTKSNDTKMIPNTFDGITVRTKEIAKTTIQVAYLDKQKLRDHTSSHDVIAFAGGSSPDKWSQNDDSAVNKNLTVARIGDDNDLFITTIANKSIKNLKANLSYAIVPSVVSNLTLEAHYVIPLSKEWKVVPSFRYMQQFDHLNADYNVANLSTKHDGYKESAKQSLDANLLALRVDFKNKAFLGRLGYSYIADKADIVAPWRGFPTGGFTRAMAQYNWYANTKTYMAQAGYNFNKAGIKGFSIMTRYAIQDNDDSKAGVVADSSIIHIDARQNIGDNLELKLRLGFVDYKSDTKDINEVSKADLSYNEYRLELNYFF